MRALRSDPKVLAVVPARLASQRLPRKPLLPLGGRPLVERVCEAIRASNVVSRLIVATPDDEIADCVRKIGVEAQMTDRRHTNGTERVGEIARQFPDVDVFVNVQVDQPFVSSEMLTRLLQPFVDGPAPPVTTLASPPQARDTMCRADVVKVVVNRADQALYFSRADIPYARFQVAPFPVGVHIGLYAFRRDALLTYSTLPPTPLEQCEGLEQLRFLEWGMPIQVAWWGECFVEVNSLEDLSRAERLLASSA